MTQLSVSQWRYTCSPGYYSITTAPLTLTCSIYTGITSTPPACNSCGSTYYCLGAMHRARCPAGTWADASALNLQMANCSGLCLPGYYCPVGSTNNAPFKCGTVDKYCPAGSGAPIVIAASDNSRYTGPVDAPVDLREYAIPCPPLRQCSAGVLLPPVVVDYLPDTGIWKVEASILEDKTNISES